MLCLDPEAFESLLRLEAPEHFKLLFTLRMIMTTLKCSLTLTQHDDEFIILVQLPKEVSQEQVDYIMTQVYNLLDLSDLDIKVSAVEKFIP